MDVNLSNKLAALIDAGTKRNPLPMVKGNSIRIGKVAIRFSKNKGYILFDCEDSKQICIADSKPGALAIAKKYNQDQDIAYPKMYDKEYIKHDNDCVFYEYTYKNTNDIFKKNLAQIRLEISKARKYDFYQKLEAIIFN